MWDCKIDFKSDILQPKIKSKKFEKELNKTPKKLIVGTTNKEEKQMIKKKKVNITFDKRKPQLVNE